MTIGVDFVSKRIPIKENQYMKVQIWDTGKNLFLIANININKYIINAFVSWARGLPFDN